MPGPGQEIWAQEREQQMNTNVVKYKGAYYHPVEALQQQVDPGKRLPGGNVGDAVSSEFQVMQIDVWLEGAEKVFDALVASPGMEKYDDKRKAIDAYITKARAALKNLKALTGRMGDKIESQQETIVRFQNALKELQTKRAASVQRTSEKMATQEKAPEMVKYAGHLYVLAEDEEKEEEKEEEEQMEEEGGEEMELLDALKGYWQTILDKLPDDLEVDEEFEAALNGIDEVIAVMDKVHAEYADEAAGEEESSEEEPEGE
jgi:predicted  nucleic acid-binding Zn-ribbon protein